MSNPIIGTRQHSPTPNEKRAYDFMCAQPRDCTIAELSIGLNITHGYANTLMLGLIDKRLVRRSHNRTYTSVRGPDMVVPEFRPSAVLAPSSIRPLTLAEKMRGRA